jgi:hypothetical protein
MKSQYAKHHTASGGRCAKTVASLADISFFPLTYQRIILLSDNSRCSLLAAFNMTAGTAAIAAIPVGRE